ncbi:MAG: DUF2961 domain-containing protein [Brachybacterium sp.]|uniref:glycoside hydrolase family 172 protein n=1 Tax=Brachybacterium sp. TaxID=1891286 RepID=UPI002648955E|nr:glycoside hydrolase family 172 protein [Brachybacterium sp.]MDN5688165.1 DUF2961 domain-containing protein [Brachybacterium sp.]
MTTPLADGPGLEDVTLLREATTRSISAENRDGAAAGGGRAERGDHATAWASRELPLGWKKSPCIDLSPRSRRTIAEIDGPGVIQHLWITVLPTHLRSIVLRVFWDEEEQPSIEVPLGDFFCQGWARYVPVTSIPVTVAPAGGLNSYWRMPFRRHARVEVENLSTAPIEGFFYQLTWSQEEVSDRAAYLHAQWRRSDPLEVHHPHLILDGVRGQGHYVGTYLAWESHQSGWWGEGEVKFYLDDDLADVGPGEGGEGDAPPAIFPTICGTGTEDYVGGAWAFEDPPGQYAAYSTPYLGMPEVQRPDGFSASQQRFGLYRWHLPDPIRFRQRLRVSVQALGFQRPVDDLVRYKPLRDDIASTAFWYQAEPHLPFTDDPSYCVPTWDLLDPT